MPTWAEQALQVALSDHWVRGRGEERERKIHAMLAAIEAKAEDGEVVFSQREIGAHKGDALAAALYTVRDKGLLVRLADRGRYGTSYRMLTPDEAAVMTRRCSSCRTTVLVEQLQVLDPLQVFIHWQSGFADFDLVICHDCPMSAYPEGTCAGCGNRDAPCKVNGRPVCPDCYWLCLNDKGRRKFVAGATVLIDFTPAVDSLVEWGILPTRTLGDYATE